MPWAQQAFVSWAGLRGAVPIVLATFPLTFDVPGATIIFDTVFVLVVVFTLVQGWSLPWVARGCGIATPLTPATSRSSRHPWTSWTPTSCR